MRICYLVIAHAFPRHLSRLLPQLTSEGGEVFVHIDKKVPLETFSTCRELEHVHFIDDRVPVSWGGFSDVQATLNLIHAAKQSRKQFDYFSLLSGTHYPLRPQRAFEAYLKNTDKEFISITRVPNYEADKTFERFSLFHIDKSYHRRFGLPQALTTFTARAINKLKLHRRFEHKLAGMTPYCGWQWWTLSDAAINHIMDFTRRHPEVAQFFKHTLLPDESFFQTIMANSPFRDKLARDVTYTYWKAPNAPHPEYLDHQHVDMLIQSELKISDTYGVADVFFARKFSDDSEKIVERINQTLLQ